MLLDIKYIYELCMHRIPLTGLMDSIHLRQSNLPTQRQQPGKPSYRTI